jgi:hypothetical protein
MPINASSMIPHRTRPCREIEPDAEITGDEWREHRVVRLIRQHAVDLGGFESCIEHGVAHRDRCERPRRHVRAAGVGGLADADDGVLVAQELRHGGVDVFSGQGHFLKLPIGFFFVASPVPF